MAQGTTRSGVCAYGMALQRGLSEVANLLRDTCDGLIRVWLSKPDRLMKAKAAR